MAVTVPQVKQLSYPDFMDLVTRTSFVGTDSPLYDFEGIIADGYFGWVGDFFDDRYEDESARHEVLQYGFMY